MASANAEVQENIRLAEVCLMTARMGRSLEVEQVYATQALAHATLAYVIHITQEEK